MFAIFEYLFACCLGDRLYKCSAVAETGDHLTRIDMDRNMGRGPWPNGWTNQYATWHIGRPRPRRHCVRWWPSSPPPKKKLEHSTQPFGPCDHVYCGQTVAHLSNCWARLISLCNMPVLHYSHYRRLRSVVQESYLTWKPFSATSTGTVPLSGHSLGGIKMLPWYETTTEWPSLLWNSAVTSPNQVVVPSRPSVSVELSSAVYFHCLLQQSPRHKQDDHCTQRYCQNPMTGQSESK